ncbi:MAG: cytochrome c biogenesis protein CcsA [Deltaproteobacteria bacterium]|nr:cytochrome c biogenesis protein CcsA [Deltaproteobacteria bacterium]
MEKLSFGISLFFILLATGGSLIYIIRQRKIAYTWSTRILVTGFVFLSASLCMQYYRLGIVPALSLKSSLSFFAWVIIGLYLILQWRFRLMVLGSFIIPLTAVLLIVSLSIPGMDVSARPMLKNIWLPVHVISIFIGDGMFTIAFMAAVMYLLQERHIKIKKRGSLYTRLPSLETLDSINAYSLKWGFPFMTFGMITGAFYAQSVLGSYWRWDPKEVWSLITWIAYAVLLHERLAVGWRGRRAAVVSIACFLILIFTFLGGSLWLSDYHSFESLKSQ